MASTRRSLLKKMAASPALLTLLGRAERAEAAETTPTPTPTPAAEKKPSLLAQAARERYGKFLTEEQGAMLDERMAALERTSARLRALKFKNGEEPATDFHALRSLGGGGRVKRSSFAKSPTRQSRHGDGAASEDK
jgi:hypothetical protein